MKVMELLSSLLGGDEWRSKPPEEQAADISRHQALRKANEASARHVREEGPAYYLFQNAIIESEQHVPWWRR